LELDEQDTRELQENRILYVDFRTLGKRVTLTNIKKFEVISYI